jgi:hypothetical protein
MQLFLKSPGHVLPTRRVAELVILLLAWSFHASIATAQSLTVVETDKVITVKDDGQVVFSYNKIAPPAPDGIDAIYRRSGCLHPVSSPKGRTVTAMFPADHPHQQGVFSAWVKTKYDGRDVNFWDLAGGTGRVLHERVVSKFEKDGIVGFEVDLVHRAEVKPTIDVLRERWRITVFPTDGSYHCFDLQTTQTAITDKPLMVEKYHYGGMALRGPPRWLAESDSYAREHRDLVREPSGFVNDLGSNREKGNHQRAKWVALTGRIDGKPVSIAVLCHAKNFRAPQAARLHPSKPYMCFAPSVDEGFQIDRDHPFKARYRYLITDAEPNAKWLSRQWEIWCRDDKPLAR